MEIQSDVHNHDDLDLLNSDNENGYGYEFEKYSDAEDEDGTNSSDHKLVKRGITRLCKFCMTYGKPGSVKLKKVKKESRDKLWDEITRYFDVDSTARGLVMHRLGQLLRNFRMKLREKYILPNLDTPRNQPKKDADDKIKEGTLNLDDDTDAMTIVFSK
ncbi:hypothetical protein Tco_1196653, partial [Tanacetum coccineum]